MEPCQRLRGWSLLRDRGALSAVIKESIVQLAVPDRLIAQRLIGLNLGWMPDLEEDQSSRAYVELEVDRRPFGVGLGYVWEPAGLARGFQATARMLFLFARATYR